MTDLYVPAFGDDEATVLDAALRYADAGWYVLPIDPVGKHAGSVLGKGWPAKTSRDPHQITAWFAGAGDGVALHVGRSGAVAFDVDDPDALPLVLADNLSAVEPPYQSSRPDVTGQGHYLFQVPAGRNFGNGAGALRGAWGEIRGRNGILVCYPTPHSKGGRYRWLQTGPVPMLPDDLAELLPEVTDATSAATDAETAAFLLRHNTGHRNDLVDVLFEKINSAFNEGQSRHQTFVDVTTWAMREAHAGLYPAGTVADRLRRQFISLMAYNRKPGERAIGATQAAHEFAGILAWAVAQAEASNADEVRAAIQERLTPAPVTVTANHRITLIPASAFKPVPVRWGWEQRMPIGEITLIPGREGLGKSLFLTWMAAQLTQGTLPGEYFGQPRAVLYHASEDSWRHTITPRLIAAGADTDLVYHMAVEGEGRLSIPVDCAYVAEAALQVHAAALMLDPIVSVIDDRINVNQGRELRQALEPLRLVAEAGGMMVAGLAHFNKASDTDVLSKIPGARAWAEVARSAIGLAEDEAEGHRVVSQIKSNLGRLDLPHLTYDIIEEQIMTDEGPAVVGKLIWTGQTERGVSEILGTGRRVTDSAPRGSHRRNVTFHVNDHGHPLAIAEIAEAFPDITRPNLRQLLRRAVEAGEVSNPTYGYYGPV